MEKPSVLIDSSSSRIKYEGTRWRQVSENSTNALGGSLHVYDAEGEPEKGAMMSVGEFLTRGYEVWGTANEGLLFEAKIDDVQYHALDSRMHDTQGKQGARIFEAGIVPGNHALHLAPQKGQFIVDYILFEPAEKTNLNGEDLIFDDANVSFNYTGTWTSITPDLPELPFNRTLMSTTLPGSTLSFPFTGSSITVYGAFNRSTGVVSADFSVDDSEPTPLVLVNQTSEQPGWTLHHPYFKYDIAENPQDVHTLHVTVKATSASQPFYIDYVIVRGNEHSRIAERDFKKTGAALKNSGMTIGISFLAIIVVILLAVTWRLYRKRQKAKATPPNNLKA